MSHQVITHHTTATNPETCSTQTRRRRPTSACNSNDEVERG
jgi:hypothetical protein